ncbi:hypothetical protein CPB85DRAFT_1440947 [Mucidula mucida]|nr:hypothetical protein CPB85DRAFT_1440947 [Mucidula mucida]
MHGKSLYDIRDYADFTFALTQLVQGLERVHLAGFIHYAISPGNCLLSRTKRRFLTLNLLALIMLLRVQAIALSPFTGTPPVFMAVEYQVGQHLFEPLLPFNFKGRTRPGMPEPPAKKNKAPWFRFNFLHDLESVL